MSSGVKTTTTDIFCEFFEVAVHNIIYARKLYPETIFERKRKYGVTVYQSIHPDVNEYIAESLKAINFHLNKNQLRYIYLCFLSSGKITEKFTFDVINLSSSFESDPFLLKLEQFLRDFCLKLHASLNYVDDLSEDATFSIQLNVTEYSNLEFNQDPAFESFPWILLNDKETELGSPEIVPLHSIETDFLKLQIYIEKPCSECYSSYKSDDDIL